MQIKENISLKPYNTFGIDVNAKHFVTVKTLEELKEILTLNRFPEKLILGGGSNMLLTKAIDALVVHINLKGIEVVSENDDYATIKANAGENWHDFVLWCLDRNYGGLENLSLIPGNVGTAPIQNIGAYGVELKDTFVECDAINGMNGTLQKFTHKECGFDYRNSVFKQELKGKYIITSVTFKLSKKNHTLHTNYGAITSELESHDIKNPSIKDISNAVIAIRESKLPNPKEIGNSGSFFKNPIISKEQHEKLLISFPEMPSYKISKSEVKVPAGWLIEKAGFKGKDYGGYGVHKKQALVLVNYGDARGSDILNLAKLIQKTVYRIFNISIEAEVNIL